MTDAPHKIGEYQIIRSLGEGGMGQVFLARRTYPGGVEKLCVIKTIRQGGEHNERWARLFLQEAKVTASLQHQNIVDIYEFGSEPLLFMAMEYVEGRDLSDVIAAALSCDQAIPLNVVLRIAVEVLRGLDHAHNRKNTQGLRLNIVHRDLTPRNILISNEGEVKIADFGIAKALIVEDKTQTGELKGKLHYLSPEQIDGKELDARADLFALGIVIYEMLTGERPFEADSVSAMLLKISRCDYAPASSRRPLPAALDGLLARLLCREPADRFASAAEALTQVELLLSQLAPSGANTIRDYLAELFGKRAVSQAEVLESGDDSIGELSTLVRTPAQPAAAEPERTASEPTLLKRPHNYRPAAVVIAAAAIVGLLIWALPAQREHRPEAQQLAVASAGSSSALAALVAAEPTPLATPEPTPAPTPPSIPTATPRSTPIPTPRPTPLVTPQPTPMITPRPTPAATPRPTPDMAAAPGTLGISVTPWAKVWVDGIYMGLTPLRIELKPGLHSVTLKNEQQGLSNTVNVTIKSGQTTKVLNWP